MIFSATARRAAPAILAATALLVAACSAGESDEQGTPSPSASQAPRDDAARDPAAEFTIQASDIGVHSFTTQPEVPKGSIRLNCFPQWRVVNPEPGIYDWDVFDEYLTKVEAWGFTDIVYVFCATPDWAAKPLRGENDAAFAPLAAQPPRRMEHFREYVAAVASRYKGRITGYQVWNEASTTQFFNGTPAQMAQMTEVVHSAVEEADPDALVISASSQTHVPQYLRDFYPDYMAALQERDWPVDAVAVHGYPLGSIPAERAAQERVRNLQFVQRVLTSLKAPAEMGLWDTEVNYGQGQPGGEPDGRISGETAAALTARSYLDGWRLGVRRTYWYFWTPEYIDFVGIQMRPGDPSTQALATLSDWVTDATYQGCEKASGAIVCSFTKSGTAFDIAYADRGTAVVTLPRESEVCPVFGGGCASEQGTVRVTATPVRIG